MECRKIADEQRPDPRRPTALVRRKRDEVGMRRQRVVGGHLRRIDQQQTARRMHDLRDSRDRLAHPRLAVRPLHRDDRTRIALERVTERIDVDHATARDREAQQFPARAQRRVMFDRAQ